MMKGEMQLQGFAESLQYWHKIHFVMSSMSRNWLTRALNVSIFPYIYMAALYGVTIELSN